MGSEFEPDLDPLAHHPAHQLIEVADKAVQVHGLFLKKLPARERQHLLRQAASIPGGLVGPRQLQTLALAAGLRGGLIDARHHDRHQVVEGVGDPGRRDADRIEPLLLLEGSLLAPGHVHLAAEVVEQPAFRIKDRTDVEGVPKAPSVVAVIVDFRSLPR